MTEAHRTRDNNHLVKSFVVEKRNDGTFAVKTSHWAVGYTPAHCATEREAIEHAIKSRNLQTVNLGHEVYALVRLLEEQKAEPSDEIVAEFPFLIDKKTD